MNGTYDSLHVPKRLSIWVELEERLSADWVKQEGIARRTIGKTADSRMFAMHTMTDRVSKPRQTPAAHERKPRQTCSQRMDDY
jgi:hypothetical protein